MSEFMKTKKDGKIEKKNIEPVGLVDLATTVQVLFSSPCSSAQSRSYPAPAASQIHRLNNAPFLGLSLRGDFAQPGHPTSG